MQESKGAGVAHQSRIPVVYIAGSGRSGSTILDVLLGRIPGFASVGELRYIWERGYDGNWICGCGDRFHDCGFWAGVTRCAFDDPSASTIKKLCEIQPRVIRKARLPHIVFRSGSTSFKNEVNTLRDALGRVYRSIKSTSGCDVVVDASKDPVYGCLLSQVPGVELHTIHLIRDSRAVAYSWNREKLMTLTERNGEYMNRYPPTVASRGWMLANLLATLLRSRSKSYTQVHYEKFAAFPSATLSTISTVAGGPSIDEAGFLDLCRSSAPNHGVSGNPSRLQRGDIVIRPDEKWRTKFASRDRMVVTTLTLPWLLRYGYLGRGRESSGD